MTPELRRACDQVRELLADSHKAEIDKRHAVGSVVDKLMNDPNRYGKRAVARVAKELKFNKSTLYKDALVYKAWPKLSELKAKLRKAPSGTVPVSWSHLVELAPLVAKKRDDMLTRAIEQGLSLRELHRELTPRQPASASRPASPLRALLASTHALASHAAVQVERMQQALSDPELEPGQAPPLKDGLEIAKEILTWAKEIRNRVDTAVAASRNDTNAAENVAAPRHSGAALRLVRPSANA